MAPLCVQRPNYGSNQWMGGGGVGGGNPGWGGSMGGGWSGSGMTGSGYYPGSMGFGTNNYWPSYGGSGYGSTTPGYGSGYGSGYGAGYGSGTGHGSGYDTTNQWSPWSYGQGGWSNSWAGGGNRKGKTNTSPQVDRQQAPPSKVNSNSNNRNPSNDNINNHNFFPRIPTKSVSSISQVKYPEKSTYNPQSSYNPQQQSTYTPINPNSKYDDIIVQQEIM